MMASLTLQMRSFRETFVGNGRAAYSIGGTGLSFREVSTCRIYFSSRRSGGLRQGHHSISRLEEWIVTSTMSRTIGPTTLVIGSVFLRLVKWETYREMLDVDRDCLCST